MSISTERGAVEEFDLLDVILVLVKSWRILVIGPLLVMLIAGFTTFLNVPSTNPTASSIIWLSRESITTLASQAFMQDAAEAIRNLNGYDWDLEELSSAITIRSVQGVSNPAASIVPPASSIKVTAQSPDIAVNTLKTLIETLKLPRWQDPGLTALKTSLESYERQTKDLQASLDTLNTLDIEASEISIAAIGIPVSVMADRISQNLATMAKIRDRIANWPNKSVLKPVALNATSESRIWIIVPILCAIGAEMILLFLVFLRAAAEGLASTSEGERKMQEIRTSLKLRR